MRKLILIAALLLTSAAAAQIINEGASFVSGGGGGSSGPVALIKQTTGYEGSTFTVVGKSTLDFSHRLAVQYRYIAGAYALHLGQSNVALTYTDYFADAGTSHNESKLISTPGLYDGDSLYVRVVVTALDSSVVLDTLERGYLIDHDIVTLAMGNPYAGTRIFNPTGLVFTDSLTHNSTVKLDSTKFRHGFIRRDIPDSCFNRPTTTVSLQSTWPLYTPGAACQYGMFWWDLTHIPDNVTITDAYICVDLAYSNNLGIAAGEGLVAVLDTMRADIPWTTASVGNCASWMPLYTNTGWAEANRKTDAAWSPTLQSRSAGWFWGLASEPCRDITGDAGTMATNDDVLINVKDVLQYWVDYHDERDIVNAGFWITGFNNDANSVVITSSNAGSQENRSPSLIVRYQPKKFNGYAWDGYPFVMVFTTDDAHEDNLEFMDELDETGHKYTMFAVQDRLNITDYMTSAELLDAYERGFEIGNHGSRHNSFDVVEPDSIPIMLERDWLATILGLAGQDTALIKSYAYAFGDTGAIDGDDRFALTHLNNFGYIGARLAGNISTNSPTELDWNAASNVFLVDKWNAAFLSDSNDTHPDSIRTRFRLVYGRSTQRGGATSGEPIVFLTHSADDPNYSDNLTRERLGLVRDEAVRRGDTLWTTFEHMMLLYRAAHTSVGGKIWTLP